MIFSIEIILSGINSKLLFENDVSYGERWSGKDHVQIFENRIMITGNRFSKTQIETIDGLYKSTVYTQIIKSLIYLFSLSTEEKEIKSIAIKRGTKISADYDNKIINQLFPHYQGFQVNFSKEKLDHLFEENFKSIQLRQAQFHLLQALYEQDSYKSFEKAWKAFNVLYCYHANTKKDFDALCEMKKLILRNNTSFPESIRVVTALNDKQLRDFRWKLLIYNDYPTGKEKDLSDFVKRYSDYRIMTLLKSLIETYRKNELKTINLYDSTIAYIDSNLATVNDIELVNLFVIKYDYFLRCKLFHGEVNESMYNLFKMERYHEEMEFLSILLKTFLVELMNISDLL